MKSSLDAFNAFDDFNLLTTEKKNSLNDRLTVVPAHAELTG